ncbi:MAG TPA: tetratricopeptide repeat protein [Phycisphaerae bacterium]|nr:tetratricopeptide repeat protein [Phycisphaerae bacterium]
MNPLQQALTLHQSGNPAAAIPLYHQFLTQNPNHDPTHYNLALAHLQLGNPAAAIPHFQTVLSLAPHYMLAHANLGYAYLLTDQLDNAITTLNHAITLAPNISKLHLHLAHAHKARGELTEALTHYRRAIQLDPSDPAPQSSLLYSLYYHPDSTPESIYNEHAAWAKRLPIAHCQLPTEESPDQLAIGNRQSAMPCRLRIAYLGSNFNNHCQSLFTYPLLSHHNHEQFEIFIYSSTARPDDITDKLRPFADHWLDVAHLTDDQLAAQIRTDHIDILIDLTMHMADNRLRVLAQKPAPLQLTWLAYPGTTGLPQIDYRLTDPHLDPVPNADCPLPIEQSPNQSAIGNRQSAIYSETSLPLPNTFWCYNPLTTEPSVNALPALTNNHITFACLNNFCKITQPTLHLWSQVLHALPTSRMLILAPEGSARTRVLNQLAIDPARITFLNRQPRQQYLELYHRIDLCLDTFPYNGHTTSLDACWMGVPVITLAGGGGQTAVSRAGLSQLTNLNLPELIAHSPQEFVEIAKSFTHDLPRLAHLRSTLRERMQNSPLMNAPQFTRDIESLYRRAWLEFRLL